MINTRLQRLNRLALDLVKRYQSRYNYDPRFKAFFDRYLEKPRKLYRGVPFWQLIETSANILIHSSPYFKRYTLFKSTITPEQVKEFFQRISRKDTDFFHKFLKQSDQGLAPTRVTEVTPETPPAQYKTEPKPPPLKIGGSKTPPKEETPKEVPKITEQEKQTAAYYLWEKISKHSEDLKTEAGRQKLLHDPNSHITQNDINLILASGLIIGTDKAPQHSPQRFLNPDGSVDQHKWNRAVYEAAARQLEEKQGILETVRENLPTQAAVKEAFKEVSLSSPVQNSLSVFQRGLGKVIRRFGPNIASAGIGAAVGSTLPFAGPAAGAALGAAVGGAISTKAGATLASKGVGLAAKTALKGALATIPTGVGQALFLLSMLPGFDKAAGKIFGLAKNTVFIIAAILFMVIILPVLRLGESTSLVGPFSRVSEASPLQPPLPGGGGDIASCTFYRGGDSTPGLKFNISEWPVLISDIATRVGIPSSVLAAILRVECPNCFATTNPDYLTNDYDAHSSGVAYGVMQFTPSTFKWTYDSNKPSMVSLFGKTSVKTEIDPQSAMAPIDVLRIYSIRDSVIAAAFKIKADSGGGSWSDRSTLDKVAGAYYGCLRYDNDPDTTIDEACKTGPYNYGEDLWKSVSQCQSTSPSPSVPPPLPGSDLQKEIASRFGITMNGFDQKNLQWAYNKLSAVAQTNLKNFVQGVVITAVSSGSQQINCKSINLRSNLESEELFGVVLLHEIGHIIFNCGGGGAKTGSHETVLASEGYLTNYSRTACTYSAREINDWVKRSEDYAEMITYYLNPGVRAQTAACAGNQPNPYSGGANPQHFNLAKTILGNYP